MDLSYLLNLVSELPEKSNFKYVRGTDTCKFINVDLPGRRINSETSSGESKSWAPSYLEDLAPKIKENTPFNLSGLLNNKGSYRPILETIIAHTRDFYTLKKGTATLLVWIPSKPKKNLELQEISKTEIPSPISKDEEEDILDSIELVNRFKESFIRYWKIIDQHGAQFDSYVETFEEEMNKNLMNLSIGIFNIFEITDYSKYCQVEDLIIQGNPSMAFLKDEKGPNGTSYKVWATNRHLKNYLEILTISKFLANKKKTKKFENRRSSNCTSAELDYLAAIRTKPFLLLAGISGTGKSRIVRKLAQATVTEDLQRDYEGEYKWDKGTFNEERWKLHRPANFELIQVKPNWHNSMDVVGYLSNIPSPHYVFTPFINFIVRAMCHPEVPFFLCLDEMNLAPVEEYFAEFLSAIESRGKKNGEYLTDPIIPPFKTYGSIEDDKGSKKNVSEEMLNALSEIMDKEIADAKTTEKIKKHLREKGLTLPENLIIIGTVNMDETTFSFSRKVLDRAMSLEMNKVDYSSFLEDTTDDNIKAIAQEFKVDSDPSGESNELNRLLINRHVEAKEVVPELGGTTDGSDARFVIDYLETINKLLDGTPFKLGYRAANEALIYLQSSKDFGNDDRNNAMDRFTLMKILSRFEGDESKLKLTDFDSKRLEEVGVDFSKISGGIGGATILSAMREIILKKLGENQSIKTSDESNDEGAEINGEKTVSEVEQEMTPRESIKKLDSMIALLDKDHFVSYWS